MKIFFKSSQIKNTLQTVKLNKSGLNFMYPLAFLSNLKIKLQKSIIAKGNLKRRKLIPFKITVIIFWLKF